MSNRSRSTPQVHQIKAIFEGLRHGYLRPSGHTSRGPSYHSNISTDNLVTPQNESAVISHSPMLDAQEPIETVVETPSIHARPALSAKPSWIGPLPKEHVQHSMAHKVTITYAAPGLRPPVYITTSLSKPAWEIVEMSATITPHGGFLFHIAFDAEEGEYQYKFRLGPGDWWVCDDSQPTIDDGFGNRNNLLYVGSQPNWQDLTKIDSARADDRALKIGQLSHLPSGQDDNRSEDPDMREATASEIDTLSTRSIEIEPPTEEPLFDLTPAITSIDYDDEVSTAEQDDEPAPLLRHETVSPYRKIEPREEVPYASPAKSDESLSSFEDTFYPEVDASDPSLHHFPTHHEGIMDELRRAHRHFSERDDRTSSPESRHVAFKNSNVPVVPEADEEPGLADHLHAPAQHQRVPDEDQVEDKDVVDKLRQSGSTLIRRQRGAPAGGRDIFSRLILAVLVAVMALVLFKSGLFVSHGTVKDGGAALGD